MENQKTMKVGQILKMSDGNNEIEVVIKSTKAINYVTVQPLSGAILFKKVSYKGKAFKSNFKVI